MKRQFCLLAAVFCLLGGLGLTACTGGGTTASKPETSIVTTTTTTMTTTTTVDPATLSIFDPAHYSQSSVVKCLDLASFENGGICMNHISSQDDLVGTEPFAVFVWKGESGETMPDFPPPDHVEERNKRRDCLRGGMGFDIEKRTILFCEGVPNLGDYLMYRMTECPAVYIPDSVQSIGEHTFPENAITVIHCHAGSFAEQYAKSHGMKCEIVTE